MEGVIGAAGGTLIEYGFVTASNNLAWNLYPDKSVGVRFFRPHGERFPL